MTDKSTSPRTIVKTDEETLTSPSTSDSIVQPAQPPVQQDRKGSRSILPTFTKKSSTDLIKKEKGEKKRNRHSLPFNSGETILNFLSSHGKTLKDGEDGPKDQSKSGSFTTGGAGAEILASVKEKEPPKNPKSPKNSHLQTNTVDPILTPPASPVGPIVHSTTNPASPGFVKSSPTIIDRDTNRHQKRIPNWAPIANEYNDDDDDDDEKDKDEDESAEESVLLSRHMEVTRECMDYLAANMARTSTVSSVDQEKIKHLEDKVFLLERELKESKQREHRLTTLLSNFESGLNKVYAENITSKQKEITKLCSKISQLEHNYDDLALDYENLKTQANSAKLGRATNNLKTTNNRRRRDTSRHNGAMTLGSDDGGDRLALEDPKKVMKEQTDRMMSTLSMMKAVQSSAGPAGFPIFSDWMSCYGKDAKIVAEEKKNREIVLDNNNNNTKDVKNEVKKDPANATTRSNSRSEGIDDDDNNNGSIVSSSSTASKNKAAHGV